MKRVVLLLVVAATVCGIHGDAQEPEIMTGTWGGRLACEALLCLSTGVQPAECAPSLNFYYGIVGATPAETIALRRAFLMSCPTGGGAGLELTGPSSADILAGREEPWLVGGGIDLREEDKTALVDSIIAGGNDGN